MGLLAGADAERSRTMIAASNATSVSAEAELGGHTIHCVMFP